MTIFHLILSLLLLIQISNLHLHFHPLHLELSQSDLSSKVQSALQKMVQLGRKVNITQFGLNPYHQEERIAAMEKMINEARKTMVQVYLESRVPLEGRQYYCQNINPVIKQQIETSATNIRNAMNNMVTIPPLSQTQYPTQETTSLIDRTLSSLTSSLSKPGTTISSPPASVTQTNLAGSDLWAPGNQSIEELGNVYKTGSNQNGVVCPVQRPFVGTYGQCIQCNQKQYYDINLKKCIQCAEFDKDKHRCKPTIQTITNTKNPQGLLLPQSQTLAQYRASLPSSDVAPCPLSDPYFDGTKCISCPQGQLFAVDIKTCQTCPVDSSYSKYSYHCEKAQYYTAADVYDNWISVQKKPQDIMQTMKMNAQKAHAKACPYEEPFFDGTKCILCKEPTPLFSFDSGKCSACLNGTTFSANVHSCVIAQKHQTSMNVPNLVLDGHPLNEWKSYYVNNQTKNPQLGDCPPSKPYFDGMTCINCERPDNLFSLAKRSCVHCPEGTQYDATVRECLSSSGNIVTQNPTLAKMAASIFA